MVEEAVAFEEMKVKQLKAELAVRGAARTGVKGVLQQRLHTLIVQEAAEHARTDARMDTEESLELRSRSSSRRGLPCNAAFPGRVKRGRVPMHRSQ